MRWTAQKQSPYQRVAVYTFRNELMQLYPEVCGVILSYVLIAIPVRVDILQ